MGDQRSVGSDDSPDTADKDERSADRMRRRVSGSSLKLWVLMNASRWIVAVLVLAVVFLGVSLLVWLDPTPLTAGIEAADPVETLFQALVTSIVTGVTLVVSINSLVLSQELGAVGDQRDRMEGSLSFRADAADHLDADVSPTDPSAFLGTLIKHARQQAETVEASAGDTTAQPLRDEIDTFVDGLTRNADSVEQRLDGAQFGTFDVVSAALDFNYSLKLAQARRLRARSEDRLGDDAAEALADLTATLRLFGPAREHVKTLYFEWALIDLSRAILYAAIPALIVSIAGILTLDVAGTVPGRSLGLSNQAWVVLGATVVSLAPFAVLLSYVLRIATVAKRTLAIGPFVLRETAESDSFDSTE